MYLRGHFGSLVPNLSSPVVFHEYFPAQSGCWQDKEGRTTCSWNCLQPAHSPLPMRGCGNEGKRLSSASICERTVLVKYSQGGFAHWSFSFGCSLIFYGNKSGRFFSKNPLNQAWSQMLTWCFSSLCCPVWLSEEEQGFVCTLLQRCWPWGAPC